MDRKVQLTFLSEQTRRYLENEFVCLCGGENYGWNSQMVNGMLSNAISLPRFALGW